MPKIWDARYNNWYYEEYMNGKNWEWWYRTNEKNYRIKEWWSWAQQKTIVNWQPVWTDVRTTQLWKWPNWTYKLKAYDKVWNVYWTSDLWDDDVFKRSIEQQKIIDENYKLAWWNLSWLNWVSNTVWWRQYVNVWWKSQPATIYSVNEWLKAGTVSAWTWSNWNTSLNYWNKWQSWILWLFSQDIDKWTEITYDPWNPNLEENIPWTWTTTKWKNLNLSRNRFVNSMNKSDTTTSSSWWWSRTTSRRKPATTTQSEPTYVDPNWVTHTWMTQEEFNNSMAAYAQDFGLNNNQPTWNNWSNREQIFNQAIDKFISDPDSFNQEQRDALIRAWQSLWYISNTSAWQQPTTVPAQYGREWSWSTEQDKVTQWWQRDIPFYL